MRRDLQPDWIRSIGKIVDSADQLHEASPGPRRAFPFAPQRIDLAAAGTRAQKRRYSPLLTLLAGHTMLHDCRMPAPAKFARCTELRLSRPRATVRTGVRSWFAGAGVDQRCWPNVTASRRTPARCDTLRLRSWTARCRQTQGIRLAMNDLRPFVTPPARLRPQLHQPRSGPGQEISAAVKAGDLTAAVLSATATSRARAPGSAHELPWPPRR